MVEWEKEICGSPVCRWNKIDLCCSAMCIFAFGISLLVVFLVTPRPQTCDFVNLVPREKWGARETVPLRKLSGPVDVVLLHQTGSRACDTNPGCKEEMRALQKQHMDQLGMPDIGYSFVVGENGWVYQARGWEQTTQHVSTWDGKSVSIAIMGEFNSTTPNHWAMNATKTMLECGVENGVISPEYKLYVRRDEGTAMDAGPGPKLSDIVKDWDHYQA